ncbi:MAG: cupin domain-containing protein [Polaromonas sp.]|uniref:cupin domain-containing protein n=1 Tax=Polaromonas sp. TaxID=1869339 RepID=UPI002488030B|nr:cupin domain-containing protein [Polaromonas sp.]MDI1239002.1 cupin domain-containing protein [Polaromonas sp.]MDI1272498.1 cupin domain-containing protein [Polaromonas sp.]MDI1340804.1 cupin domain-containing protein [Polaromonas sp.]
MALDHAQPLDVINVQPLAGKLPDVKTHSLLKTGKLQLMRLVLAAGQNVPEHQVSGEITIHCLEGQAVVSTPGLSRTLGPGELMALPGGEPHALQATTDASLLVTILLNP